MTLLKPGELLHAVAVRLVAQYLVSSGAGDIRVASTGDTLGPGIDLSYVRDGDVRRAKVKGDPYFGTNPRLIADLSLPFYRADCHAYALETIADAATREPGWVFTSEADELLYLFTALTCTEEQAVSALKAADDVFIERLKVERDELHALPMAPTREWLTVSQALYPARPVTAGRFASWVRLVPTSDVAAAVGGIVVHGSVVPV